MKGMLKGVAVLAFAAVVGATTVEAQGVKFGVAGTALIPLESPNGGTAFGGMALVGFGGKTGSPLGFRVDATVIHKGVTSILGTADVVYTFNTAPSSMFHPYLLAGGGVVHVGDAGGEGSLTKPMAKAGVGADYMMGSVMLFGEATFDGFFYGGGSGMTKSLQANVGVKFGK